MKMFLLILLIFIDQSSKYLIRHFGGFYICNSHIAFGIALPAALFWVFWLTIIALLVFKFFNFKFSWSIFILSGAVSNVIDRLYFGCITDFIDLKVWPIFNLADSFIVIGVIMLIISKFKIRNS